MTKNHTVVPTFNRSAKKFVALIEGAGFVFDRVNSKGIAFFTHDLFPERRVNSQMTDHVLHNETRRFQRMIGDATNQDKSKRNVDQVKARRARDRDRAASEFARLTAERDRLVVERDSFVARFGVTTSAEARAVIAQIEKTEREMRYWESLMTEVPNAAQRGVEHAKHRA